MQKKCVPYGSDVSAGKFKCVDCGREITTASVTSLPPCPNINSGLAAKLLHTKKCWEVLSGNGDNPRDPYPSR
mgnify:CR=1 FL=1